MWEIRRILERFSLFILTRVCDSGSFCAHLHSEETHANQNIVLFSFLQLSSGNIDVLCSMKVP